MGYVLVKRERKQPKPKRAHACKPPTGFWRWWGQIHVGSIVRCDCGQHWSLELAQGGRGGFDRVPTWMRA